MKPDYLMDDDTTRNQRAMHEFVSKPEETSKLTNSQMSFDNESTGKMIEDGLRNLKTPEDWEAEINTYKQAYLLVDKELRQLKSKLRDFGDLIKLINQIR